MKPSFLGPLLVSGLHLSLVYPDPQVPVGAKGYARYVVRDSQLKDHPLKKGTQILSLQPDRMEFLVPIDDLRELDTLGSISHDATGLCGSFDFFPLHYQMAESISHTPPFFAASAHFTTLEPILEDVTLSNIDATINTLAALPSRFHKHSTGQNASETISGIWKSQTQNSNAWSIAEFPHRNTAQRSVIARLEGQSSDTVVLGAHLDSITGASRSNPETAAPGADDDASGIAILAEIMRIIESRHLRFHRSIEFQGYAAEEVGLVGSREIAANYRASGKLIDAMLQFDMAYYSRVAADGGLLFFLEDFTTLDLTRSGIQWIKGYMGEVYRRGAMPQGAASDHKAWFEQGYPTLFPFENALADNPFIHSISDTRDQFDDGIRIRRMVQFGLLFLAYEAGLESLDSPYAPEQERLRQIPISADLFLAVSGGSGQYQFSLSAPADSNFLEFCQTESASDFRCSGTRFRLTQKLAISGRQVFFSDENLKFNADEKWRVEAYSASDELLARRQIEWQKP